MRKQMCVNIEEEVQRRFKAWCVVEGFKPNEVLEEFMKDKILPPKHDILMIYEIKRGYKEEMIDLFKLSLKIQKEYSIENIEVVDRCLSFNYPFRKTRFEIWWDSDGACLNITSNNEIYLCDEQLFNHDQVMEVLRSWFNGEN